MTRRFALGGVLVVLGVGAAVPILGQAAGMGGESTQPAGGVLVGGPAPAGGPPARTITDADVMPFDLVVHWKALCVLGSNAQPTGIYATDQEVLVTDTFTRLSCYDLADGKRRWYRPLDQPYQPLSEPVVDRDDLFTVAAGHLVVMDRRYGSERWRTKLKNVPVGAPAVAGEFVYVAGSDGWMYAFSRRDQKEAWYFNARAPFVSRPVVVGNEDQPLVFTADSKKRIYCFSNMERKLIWQDETVEPVVAAPARVERDLYLPCSDFNLYCIDVMGATSQERLKWVFRSGSQVFATPVVVGATVYFPSFRNGFYAVRRLDGQQRWWRETGTRLLSVGARRCYLLDDDGAVLICDKLTGQLEGRYVPPRSFQWAATNAFSDAIYLLNGEGLIVCLREREALRGATTAQPIP